MVEISYKGYLIEADPHQLAESGEWTIFVSIYRHRGSRTTEKPFYDEKRFKTKEEAIQYCFYFARQIIDGKVKNCTVDDL